MLARAQENLAAAGAPRRVKTLLADAGYWSDREIARSSRTLRRRSSSSPPSASPPTARAAAPRPGRGTDATSSRLPSRRGLYARRPQICDPVFEEIKWVRGARRFMRRNLKRRSLIVSSNKTFSAWAEIFGDPVAVAAMVDRLVHHAEVIVPEW